MQISFRVQLTARFHAPSSDRPSKVDSHEVHAGVREIQDGCESSEHVHDDVSMVECEESLAPRGE